MPASGMLHFFIWVGLQFQLSGIAADLPGTGKGVFKVGQVTDDKIAISADLTKGQNVLIVRKMLDDDDFESIATGKVLSSAGKRSVISFDRINMKKLPDRTTDFVVVLGSPKKFEPPPDKKIVKESGLEVITPETPEPGFIALKYKEYRSKFTSETENRANQFKQISSFKKTGFELEWYTEFLSSYGINLGQSSGTVPVSSYYREDVTAQISETFFQLNFRSKLKGKWRYLFHLRTNEEGFVTENPDEYVLSSRMSAVSLGGSVLYEVNPLLYTSTSSSFKLGLFKISAFNSISGQIQDLKAKRGSSGLANVSDINATLELLTYLPWMPYIKRYFLDLTYFQLNKTYKFSGATSNDQGGSYIIPENRTYRETESGYSINFGFRIEDYIGRIFQPKH